MPLYKFQLRDGASAIFDDAGINLPDREHALAYAKEVARELMQGREVQTRPWRLDIYENHSERVFALPFAAVDATLDHLVPELRSTLERLCDSYLSWQEAVQAARITLRESQALVARSRGKPYLASTEGQQTIR
jgi:hypothetical protein